MPVVPFSPQQPKQAKPKPMDIPTKDEPWLLMAAAAMDAQGRLIDKPKDPVDVA